MKKNSFFKPSNLILFIILLIICIMWLFPLYYILMSALRTDDSFRSLTFDEAFGFMLFPKDATLETFKAVWADNTRAPVGQWFMNSLIVAAASTILEVLVASMAAFGYSRLDFPGRKVIFGFLMFTMMIPGVVNLIPQYKIVSMLGLKNNLLALILPGLAGVGNIFLIRQFFYSIPKDYDEAAKIDGASSLRVFYQILLPQLVPVLVVVGLNTFLGSWNDLLWPIIIIEDTSKRTLTAGLSAINGVYDRNYASKMAATVISVIPVVIIFLVAQNFLLQGISLSSGLKD